jgi:CBS domain containing-hemolysin-like protein
MPDDVQTIDVILLVVYVAIALGVSFACSVFEAVLLSITPGYVAALEKEGSKVSKRIADLKANVDKPLSAILSLNTIAHTVGAAGAGAQAAKVFGDDRVGIASAVLTVLILIVSEIIPKSLGSAHWKKLAPSVTWILVPLTVLMTWTLFVPVARGVTRMLGGTGHPSIPSREEISAIAEQGAREGVFPSGESRVLQNLFRIADLKAADVMTPRTVVFGLGQETKVCDLVDRTDWMRFSRLPVHEGSLDHITGYVLRSDVLVRAAKGESETTLAELVRPLKAVPQGLPLSTLFDKLLEAPRGADPHGPGRGRVRRHRRPRDPGGPGRDPGGHGDRRRGRRRDRHASPRPQPVAQARQAHRPDPRRHGRAHRPRPLRLEDRFGAGLDDRLQGRRPRAGGALRRSLGPAPRPLAG